MPYRYDSVYTKEELVCRANEALGTHGVPPHPTTLAEFATRARRYVGEINLGSHYSEEEAEFLKALQKYMVEHQRPFPTFCEVLAVAASLGYKKGDACLSPSVEKDSRKDS
jgi:hypothetical protein